jgi:RNA polymerase sigma-70 factor, ECF subfamily
MSLEVLEQRADLTTVSEARLVELARGRSESAIRELIKRNNQRLFRAARAVLRNDFEAEDVVQQAYITAFTKLHSFRGESLFSTWLTRIALNEAIGRMRRRRILTDVSELDAAFASGTLIEAPPSSLVPPGADDELVRVEVRAILERAIDDLPSSFRVVVVLRDIEGLSVEETASVTGLKPATVKTRLHRAHRRLQASLAGQLSLVDAYAFEGARCAAIAEGVAIRLFNRCLSELPGPEAPARSATAPARSAVLAQSPR